LIDPMCAAPYDFKLNFGRMDEVLSILRLRITQERGDLHFLDYEVSEKHHSTMDALKSVYIDRKDWTSHQRWRSQPQMPEFHVHFREEMQTVMRHLLSAYTQYTADDGNTKYVRSLEIALDVLETSTSTLSFHVRIEEGHFFPSLIKAYPEYDSIIRTLYDDHKVLHHAEDKTKKSLGALVSYVQSDPNKTKSGKGQDDVRVMFHQVCVDFLDFDKTLMDHLGEEEEIVVPLGLSRRVDF
jgi:hypothetical protein